MPGAIADDCKDAGGRAMLEAIADDCKDVVGRAAQGAEVTKAKALTNQF